MTYGRAIFGDNQFLGVNHSDQAKAAELFRKYAEADSIIETLGVAYAAGIRDFMFTTHERYYSVFSEITRSNLFPGMHYTPCLPYAHKYWNAMSERGIVPAAWSTIRGVNPLRVAPAMLRAAFGDFSGMLRLLTDIELLMCKGLPVRGVFQQNLLFDLLLAVEAHGLIEDYHNYVADRLGAIPGFITMNHPLAVNVLCDAIGLGKPWVCANFNAAGFRTNPSQSSVEASFASGRTHNIAMSVFSACSGSPAENLNYVMRARGIDSILFGSSTPTNITQNASVILESDLATGPTQPGQELRRRRGS